MTNHFRITYDNGFEIVNAPDIFAAVAQLKRQYKQFFKMPRKVEQVDRNGNLIT